MRRARWIAVWCLVWGLAEPFMPLCFGQPAEPDSDEAEPLVQPTNDLAWQLTFEMNVGQVEVLQIQKLLNPRDLAINPDAPEPDLERAEKICRAWLDRTAADDASVLLAAIRF